jgi:hypothetical protein
MELLSFTYLGDKASASTQAQPAKHWSSYFRTGAGNALKIWNVANQRLSAIKCVSRDILFPALVLLT